MSKMLIREFYYLQKAELFQTCIHRNGMLLLRGLLILYTETAGNKNICYLNMSEACVVSLKFKLTETHGSFSSLRIAKKTI